MQVLIIPFRVREADFIGFLTSKGATTGAFAVSVVS